MSTDRTAPPPSLGATLIAAERRRQIDVEGYTLGHDQYGHSGGLVAAAACYLAPPAAGVPRRWPWPTRYWKPTPEDRIRELVKAGALIAAEIDRRSGAGSDLTGRSGDE